MISTDVYLLNAIAAVRKRTDNIYALKGLMPAQTHHWYVNEVGFSDDGHLDVGCCVGIADLLAALRIPQKRFQDAGRGPGSAAHPVGEMWAMLGNLLAKRNYT